MTVSAWISKASKLHKTCVEEQQAGNGSTKITMLQATTLNELQHAIGSNHGIKQVTYNEARLNLDEMFVMVKAGQKTPPLTTG
ncbi:hypothetical protein [Chryseobacterium daecheongense]|uniref:Uncharacterized protein n=1 Tax=Chryseobacterium daecheongense TaxID=192389 RepID=A0A3N0W6F7_9FLAO|nr:hypothetical protein [Chryseobacterium daecheongense]ROI00637.1 hypothetical protein EGI05_07075 [Chryseobacterium daecheongense]TDX94380.1 hypothetical protein BCF50_0145 [Chryseobacterium daecheongense]